MSLFKPPQLWDFLQVFFFMTGLFLTDYSVYGFLPNILTLKGRGFDTTTYSLIYGFALFMAFLGYNFYGWLSDRTGRKILTQWYCVFLVVFGIPVFYVLYHAAIAAESVDGRAGMVMAAMLKLAWGVVPAYFANVSRPGGAPRVSASAILRERCWAHGSAFTCGGRTRSRLSLRSRGRTYGCRRP